MHLDISKLKRSVTLITKILIESLTHPFGASLILAVGKEIITIREGEKIPKLDLKGLSLRGALLRGVDFTGANLTGVDMAFANLKEAKLSNANLRNQQI